MLRSLRVFSVCCLVATFLCSCNSNNVPDTASEVYVSGAGSFSATNTSGYDHLLTSSQGVPSAEDRLLANQQNLIGLFVVILFLALGYYWIFSLYKKNTVMRTQLGAHNEILRDLNELLSRKNKMILSNSTELEQVNEQLQRRNKHLENFAHIVAHDIKNPLVTISMFSEILKNDLAEGAVPKNTGFVEHIRTESDGLINLIDGILNFASANLDMSKIKRIDMQSFLKELKKKYDMRYFKGIDLIIQPGDVFVYAHPLILEQLFSNLVNNCVKFKKQGSQARIRIGFKQRADDFVQFYVKDRGIGIDEARQAEVFERFGRVDTSRKYKGTGIGLTTCRRIIEKYGGQIWIESTLGEGTIIHFTLRTTAPTKSASAKKILGKEPVPK